MRCAVNRVGFSGSVRALARVPFAETLAFKPAFAWFAILLELFDSLTESQVAGLLAFHALDHLSCFDYLSMCTRSILKLVQNREALRMF